MVIVILLLLGLCAGSFINALIWRVHQQSKTKKKNKDLSIVHGRSMCPSCKHALSTADLIPVVSWLWLRGHCRYCQASIGWQYPVVELLTAGLFLVSYWQWPVSLEEIGIVGLAVWLLCLVLLIALAVYDIRWMLLPDRLVFPLIAGAAALTLCLAADQHSISYLWGALAGAAGLFGLFWCLFQLSKGAWIGGGDVKVALALGLIAGGLIESILLLFLASLLGTLVSLPLLMQSKKISHKVSFGPFLITATIIVFLCGARMLGWYTHFIEV